MTTARPIALLLGLILWAVTFAPTAFAATTPIAATAVHVEGEANYVSVKDAKSHKIVVGTSFVEGDRVKTAVGIVEIKFDNGDLIRIDRNTDMAIKSLKRDEKGSTFSIFGLFVGRVKSAVSKLASADSRFEYHTKAAIAGVGGTPPFVVEISPNDELSVDLLGQPEEPGFVYVKGFDPAQTLVNIFSGMRTTVIAGLPPLSPFQISPDRFQYLNNLLPFVTKHEKRKTEEKKDTKATTEKEEKEKEAEPAAETKPEAPQAGEPAPDTATPAGGAPVAPSSFGDLGSQLVTTNISNNISVPRVTAPTAVNTISGQNQQTTQNQGNIGQNTQSGGGTQTQTPSQLATGKIRIQFK